MTLEAIAASISDIHFWDDYSSRIDEAASNHRSIKHLYTRLHLGLRSCLKEHGAASLESEEDLDYLRARLGRRRRWRSDFTYVQEITFGRSLLRRADGLMVAAQRETHTAPEAPDERGARRVRMTWPSLEVRRMPGWVWFTGAIADNPENEVLMRVYLGVDDTHRLKSWTDVVLALDDIHLPFASKTLTSRTGSARPDNVVIYCAAQWAPEVVEVITSTVPTSHRRTETTGFGVALGPGMSAAHPEADEDPAGSLGLQRSELIWRAMSERGDAFCASKDLDELGRILTSQRSRVCSLLDPATHGHG